MVVTPSKKKSKLTYADRVVRALSEYHRAHKKHSAHLATIRAQVRRGADADKDHLGAQWSHWVTRAVNKLIDQGVVQQTEANHYALTSETKRTITAARRQSLSVAPGTPARSDRWWKVVTHLPGSRGTKRRRSVAPSDFGYDGEPETPTRSISMRVSGSSMSNKRARRSSVKGVSRMTKAQLVDALRTAEDEENNEVMHLKEELEAVRRELEVVRGDGVSAVLHLSPTSRPMTPLTPLPMRDSLPPSPLRGSEGTRFTRGPLRGVIRTESGSLVNHLSKQPTPAPSDFSTDVDMNEDPFQLCPDEPLSQNAHSTSGLATPSYTPVLAKTILPSVTDAAARISSLRASLDAKIVELNALSITHETLVSEHVALKEIFASHEVRILALCLEVKEKTELLGTQEQNLETARALALDAQTTAASLTQFLQDKSAALTDVRKALEEKEAALTVLSVEKARQIRELAEAECAFKTLKSAFDREREQFAEERDELSQKLKFAHQNEGSLRVHLEKMQEEISSRDTSNKALFDRGREAEDALRRRIDDGEKKLATAQTVIDLLTLQRDDAVRRHDATSGKLAVVQITMTTLEQELQDAKQALEAHQASVDALTRQLGDGDAQIAALGGQLQDQIKKNNVLVQDKVASAPLLEGLKAKVTGFEETIQSMMLEAAQKVTTIATLELDLQRTRDQAVSLASQVEELASERSRLRLETDEISMALSVRTAELLETTNKLVSEVANRRALENDLQALNTQNAGLSTTVTTKTSEVDQLQTQLRAAQSLERDLQGQLEAVRRDMASASEAAEARTASLENSLTEARNQASSLHSQLLCVQQLNGDLSLQVESKTLELTENHMSLESAREHVSHLEVETSFLHAAKEDLERRMEQWHDVKTQDDITIRKLQQMLARHEAFFKSQLVELDQANTLLPAVTPV